MNYATVKELAKANGHRVTDLIALASKNDPFYSGSPSSLTAAQWFAALWESFGYTSGIHLRRIHYQIISQEVPVTVPDGLPYENTEACWNKLGEASKAARYLKLVDPAAFIDRRNPDPILFDSEATEELSISVSNSLWVDSPQLPDFPTLPGYYLSGYEAQQPYHLELWAEKSTMNDVLLPLCRRYGAALQTGLGELSITATLAAAQRIAKAAESGKPTRIFYISDFDPAGQSMPVAVSRKIEYFIYSLGFDVDVRLFPVLLSAEQVQHYRLPRTPIKDTERRAAQFEARYGSGAVELDALEALYPGELNRLLRRTIEQYYDSSLDSRVYETRAGLEDSLDTIRQSVISQHQSEIDALRDEYSHIRQSFANRMASHNQQLRELWGTLQDELLQVAPSLEDYPIPQANAARELGDGLYNSQREYMDQMDAYKSFQGKGTMNGEEVAA